MRFALLLKRLDRNLKEYYYSGIYSIHYGNSNCNFGFKSCLMVWTLEHLLFSTLILLNHKGISQLI